ncbi:beta-CASP ribonuclease aCPSF1 [archaeon]|nr:MAG: beta-CASP ribonuclease aCPSF1 [archaeon]RLG65328.1 MAG: beta-CASP ribonuclease aCPSF1 [archaeon]HDM23999.1 beta-CASP ribonuclease aCPSF1 [Candidatus Bathyarchaeota archaeon]
MVMESFEERQKRIIREFISKGVEITKAYYEGASLVFYTKNPELLEDTRISEDLARSLKRRIIIRPDESIRLDEAKAKELILKIVPPEAGISNIYFYPILGEVVIEAAKPGVVIGKDGKVIRQLMHEIKWKVRVVRKPLINTPIIHKLRSLYVRHDKERVNFLRSVGERISRPTIFSKDKLRNLTWIRLTFLGAAREVGRSAILVQTRESSVLLDCGVKPGLNSMFNSYPAFYLENFSIEDLDAIIISHAHLDHCGALPFLFKYGYRGPVYCTPATRDLMFLILSDYIDVLQKEGHYTPYTSKDIETTMLHVIPLDYNEVTDISPDIKLVLRNAGHILGSSIIHLNIGEGLHNVIYTGDFKATNTFLLDAAASSFPRLETLIIESTYGGPNDVFPSREEALKRFASIIKETAENGGKLLIPVPAVGRAQEMLVALKICKERKLIPEIPIYTSGLVHDATAIHTMRPSMLSRRIEKDVMYGKLFVTEDIDHIKNIDELSEIAQGGPSILLATNGMLCGGPSLEYLKLIAADPENALIFVSYQIEGTIGRQIQDGAKLLKLTTPDGRVETLEIKLGVHTITGFSGHSDLRETISYLYRINPKPKRIIVNHGEISKIMYLSRYLHSKFKIEVLAPSIGDTISLQ